MDALRELRGLSYDELLDRARELERKEELTRKERTELQQLHVAMFEYLLASN